MADKGNKTSSTAKKPLDPKVKDLEIKDDVKGGRKDAAEDFSKASNKHGKHGKKANKYM
jgi:hypothetical protein